MFNPSPRDEQVPLIVQGEYPTQNRPTKSIYARLRTFMPIFTWLKRYLWILSGVNYYEIIRMDRYQITFLPQDLLGGISIGALLIPQSIGYALVAGLPVEYGLYSAIFPTLVYTLMGTSIHASIGPTAVVSAHIYLDLVYIYNYITI